MSRIFGIWNVDGRPADPQLLARMSDTLAHRGSEAASYFVQGSIGVGCRIFRVTPESASEAQPVVLQSGAAVVFDGRLDNRTDLINSLPDRQDVSSAASDPQLVAAAFQVFGSECIARLEGDFSLGVFDAPERRLLLARDAIGIRPLYYCRTPRAVIFASEIKAILAHPDISARPNDRLLAELMLRRLHRRDHDGTTFFEGISGVPPAHMAVITERATTVRRYWDFDGRPLSSTTSFADCAEQFGHHFRRAVQRRTRSTRPVAVSLSGGLDSSSIFCVAHAMAAAGAPAAAGFTYTSLDGSPADESPFIGEIEQHTHHAVRYVPMPAPILLDGLPELIRQIESPMVDTQRNRTEVFHDAIHASGANVLLTGHFGDQVLFNQAYLVDLLRRGAWLTIRRHLKAYPEWFPDTEHGYFVRLFATDILQHQLPHWIRRGVRTVRAAAIPAPPFHEWFSDRFRTAARDDVFETDLSRSASATALAGDFYREVRGRYHGLCLEMNNKAASAFGLEAAFPFLDRSLVEFLMSVPGELLARDGQPKALLREALKGVVPKAILRRNTKGDFTHIVNGGSRRDYDRIVSVLGPDALVVQMGYIEADKLTKGLESAKGSLAGSTSNMASWRVSSLLAFEIWLREFIGPRKEQMP